MQEEGGLCEDKCSGFAYCVAVRANQTRHLSVSCQHYCLIRKVILHSLGLEGALLE